MSYNTAEPQRGRQTPLSPVRVSARLRSLLTEKLRVDRREVDEWKALQQQLRLEGRADLAKLVERDVLDEERHVGELVIIFRSLFPGERVPVPGFEAGRRLGGP